MKKKIKKIIEESIEKYIRDNFKFEIELGQLTRGCGYFVEMTDHSSNEIEKFKTDCYVPNEETNEYKIFGCTEEDVKLANFGKCKFINTLK